jgi:hypothetical protein
VKLRCVLENTHVQFEILDRTYLCGLPEMAVMTALFGWPPPLSSDTARLCVQRCVTICNIPTKCVVPARLNHLARCEQHSARWQAQGGRLEADFRDGCVVMNPGDLLGAVIRYSRPWGTTIVTIKPHQVVKA